MSGVLKNKLGITNEIELAKAEEKLSKQKAKELFSSKLIDSIEVGTFKGLSEIHRFLFEDIYEFAGKIRELNIAKGNFRFASTLYLKEILKAIDTMPQSNFDEIVEKYVEMNIAHPFREGNGRAMRIWLDCIFKKELKRVVDWSKIDKDDYLMAMQRSPIKDTEIKLLLKNALSEEIDSFKLFARAIDSSYAYEGYSSYKLEDL